MSERACPRCRRVNVDANFCEGCGASLQPAPEICETCGHANADANFCEACGNPMRGDGGAPKAPRFTRLGAALIDAVYVSAINVPIAAAAGLISVGQPLPMSRLVLALGLGFIVFSALQVAFLIRGQTLGKWLLGLRIVDATTGDPAPLGRLLGLRYLPLAVVQLLPVIGLLASFVNVLLIFRTDRRCVHDHIAGTRVVRARDLRS